MGAPLTRLLDFTTKVSIRFGTNSRQVDLVPEHDPFVWIYHKKPRSGYIGTGIFSFFLCHFSKKSPPRALDGAYFLVIFHHDDEMILLKTYIKLGPLLQKSARGPHRRRKLERTPLAKGPLYTGSFYSSISWAFVKIPSLLCKIITRRRSRHFFLNLLTLCKFPSKRVWRPFLYGN